MQKIPFDIFVFLTNQNIISTFLLLVFLVLVDEFADVDGDGGGGGGVDAVDVVEETGFDAGGHEAAF